jgi:geranylgeranyl pyrophosphate synthase
LGIAYQIQDDIADLKKATANNILKLLDGDSGRIRSYEKMSKSYALEAIEKLKTLRIRNARSLVEMADFITSQATTGI